MSDPAPPDPKKESNSSLLGEIAQIGSAAVSPSGAASLVRLAGKSLLRTVAAITKGSIETANEIAHDINAGEPLSEIVDSRVEQVRAAAWHALGADDHPAAQRAQTLASKRASAEVDLEHQGEELLRDSWEDDLTPRDEHPAFQLILRSISPDEARILRFLSVAGAQPSLDLRTKTPFQVGSQRIAGGINMIPNMAGCTWLDRDQQYLANLNRLGLIRFSEEPVDDFRRYSLLTAQPRALEALSGRLR